MRTVFIILTCIQFICISCDKKQDKKIGLLLPNITDARYSKDNAYFLSKANELGFKVESRFANNDANLQENQAKELIEKGVNVIVISAVNQNLAASIVRYAHENKVKVIAYERIISNCDLDYMVSFDHELVGKIQAEYVSARCAHGNYVMIGGDKRDNNAELIQKGQLEVLNRLIQSGTIKILYRNFIEDWSAESAQQEVAIVSRLSNENIDVVLSANDAMAGSIINALKKSQPMHPFLITGLDADLAACRRILKGEQTMTVYKPFKKLAEISAELAVQITENKPVLSMTNKVFNGTRDVPSLLLQPIAVDSANLSATVIKDGFYNHTEVYNE